MKQRLLQRLSVNLGGFSAPIHIVDGFPMPVCLFVRVPQSQCFEGSATFGYCAMKKETYYGFQGVVMINFEGVITGFTIVPANVDKREALWHLTNRLVRKLLSHTMGVFLDRCLGRASLQFEGLITA